MSYSNSPKIHTLVVPRHTFNYWMGFHATLKDFTVGNIPSGATILKTHWDKDGAYCIVYRVDGNSVMKGTTPVRQHDV
jgi:hypothetical protein